METLDNLRASIPSYSDDNAVEKSKAVMDKCKEYWDALRLAQTEVLAFKIYYERTLEALELSNDEYYSAQEDLATEIGNVPHKDIIINDLEDCINETGSLYRSVAARIKDLEAVNSKFSEYLRTITDINQKARETNYAAMEYITSSAGGDNQVPMVNIDWSCNINP